MIILPAIDIFGGKAVRLLRGDYNEMTVYGDDPAVFANRFRAAGAKWMHLVDLEGARSGETPNFDAVAACANAFGGNTEVGGGIRDMRTAEKYLSAGITRVILGTAAVTDKTFLREAVREFGDKVAVGLDLRGGKVAVSGWTVDTKVDSLEFCDELRGIGVKTVICTDISRDGAMRGANRALYKTLAEKTGLGIVASGGVSSMEDIRELSKLSLWGVIIGRAYYTGAIALEQAIGESECLQKE